MLGLFLEDRRLLALVGVLPSRSCHRTLLLNKKTRDDDGCGTLLRVGDLTASGYRSSWKVGKGISSFMAQSGLASERLSEATVEALGEILTGCLLMSRLFCVLLTNSVWHDTA
jgi:hypothetical protein